MFIGRIDLLKSLTKQSNLFLPFGKVRMGYPLGKLGWVALGEGSDGFEGQDWLSSEEGTVLERRWRRRWWMAWRALAILKR